MDFVRACATIGLVSSLTLLGCGNGRKALSPEEALDTFQLPAGLRVELVAAEPDVVDPVAMAFDANNRLFVVEMPGYPLDMRTRGRVKLLEDKDGDGRFENSVVFADQLQFPTGVMAWRQGILVTAAPDIIYFADQDGDGQADVRQVVLTGFATTNPQLRVNGLVYGLDNWIYAAYRTARRPQLYVEEFGDIGSSIRFPGQPQSASIPPNQMQGMDVRFRPRKQEVEPVAGNSQFGNAFDAWGNRFTVWNNDHVRHVVLQRQSLIRNPYLTVRSAMQSVSDHERSAEVFPTAEGIVDQVLAVQDRDRESGRITSACGLSVYSGGVLPPEYEGNLFVCEPVHHLVHRDLLVPSGPTFVASRAREKVDFLTSRDSWFSPVFTTTGPDGALYVVDFYRMIVEHPQYIHDVPRENVDFSDGTGRGRIYRIVPESFTRTPRAQLPRTTTIDLVEELSNTNRWWRTTAQRLLVEHQDRTATSLLEEMARSGESVGRVHALWTLAGLETLGSELVLELLRDENPKIREQAVRVAETFLSEPAVVDSLVGLADDRNGSVQFQVASLLGQLAPDKSFEPLRHILFQNMDDHWFQTAILTAAADNAEMWLEAVTRDETFLSKQSTERGTFLTQLASIIGAKGKNNEIREVLATLQRHRDKTAVQYQVAVLYGLGLGLTRGQQLPITLSSAGQEHLLAFIEHGEPQVSAAAVETSRHLKLETTQQLQSMIRRAAEVLNSEREELEARLNAVRVLGLDPSGKYHSVLIGLLAPQQPEEIQVAVIESLAQHSAAGINEVLLEKWRTYTGPVREALLDEFFNDQTRLPLLLDAMAEGTIQNWALSSTQRSQLLRSSQESIRRRAKAVLGSAVEENRTTVVEQYRPALVARGDAEQGRQVFETVCSECHRIGEIGFEVGPSLLAVANRTKRDLLRDILVPSENIETGYEEYLLDTTDGRSLFGVLAQQTSSTVTLRRAKGEEVTVARSSISKLRSLGVSPMPDGLEEEISVTSMADLLTYLKKPLMRQHSDE